MKEYRCTHCNKLLFKGKYLAFLDVDDDISYIFEELKIPLIKNFPASHSKKKATIPIG